MPETCDSCGQPADKLFLVEHAQPERDRRVCARCWEIWRSYGRKGGKA